MKNLMTSPGVIRWGAMGFILLGLVWVVRGEASVGHTSYLSPAGFMYASWFFFTNSAHYWFYPTLFVCTVLFSVQMMLLALGLVGLHALQRESYGIIGRVGFYVALAATMLPVFGAFWKLFYIHVLLYPSPQVLDMTPPLQNPGWVERWVMPLVEFLGWFDPSANLVPTASVLGWLYGFALLGVATLRAAVLPRMYGVLLIILWPVWLAPVATLPGTIWWSLGLMWLGLVLAVLGQALWSRRATQLSITRM